MTDYEQAYRDLRAGVEALILNSDRRGWHVRGNCAVLANDLRALLASSAPATASEGATCGCEHPYIGTQAAGEPVRCETCRGLVTSSDGDRGLSEDEREAIERAVCTLGKVECQVLGHDHSRHLNRLIPLVERILAARAAQPEGVERVEWGHAHADDPEVVVVTSEASARAAVAGWNSTRGTDGKGRLMRRVVTPWEVVGDE